MATFASFTAQASDDAHDDNESTIFSLNTDNCVASKWVNSNDETISINKKFGEFSLAVTRCLSNAGERRKAKVLYQINALYKDAICTAPYEIGNTDCHIKVYTFTHEMNAADYEIVVVIYSAGRKLMLDNGVANKPSLDNPFQSAVENLVAREGVKVFSAKIRPMGRAS